MTEKCLRNIIQQLYSAYSSKHNSNHEKTNHSFNDSTWKKLLLSCTKKIIFIITTNNVKKNVLAHVEQKFELHKKVCENKNFCAVVIPS